MESFLNSTGTCLGSKRPGISPEGTPYRSLEMTLAFDPNSQMNQCLHCLPTSYMRRGVNCLRRPTLSLFFFKKKSKMQLSEVIDRPEGRLGEGGVG